MELVISQKLNLYFTLLCIIAPFKSTYDGCTKCSQPISVMLLSPVNANLNGCIFHCRIPGETGDVCSGLGRCECGDCICNLPKVSLQMLLVYVFLKKSKGLTAIF